MGSNYQQKYLNRRRLRFSPRFRVLNLFPDEFKSIYKGEGEDFVDLRPYQSGDNAKNISWPQYAKTEKLFVKEREVPKNLTIISAVDISQSMYWSERKIETVDAFFEILVGSLVLPGNNSLGCVGFSGGIEGEEYFPPKAGKTHFAQILKWYIEYEPKDYLTNIPLAINFLIKKARKRSVVFFISDFFEKRDFSRELRVASRNFDFVPVVISDPKEFVLFPGTRIDYRDIETGRTETIWLTKERITRILAEKSEREEGLRNLFKSCELESITLESSDTGAVVRAIHDFFRRRSVLIRRR